MNKPFFPIDRIRLFSADGQVYRAFEHLVAASMGTLLLVPERLVVGEHGAIQEGCPVPAEEVYAVLHYPSYKPVLLTTLKGPLQVLQGLGIDPADCDIDRISPMVMGREKVLRLVHPCGLRYAVVMP